MVDGGYGVGDNSELGFNLCEQRRKKVCGGQNCSNSRINHKFVVRPTGFGLWPSSGTPDNMCCVAVVECN